jgi:hypothetical protein
VTTKRPFCMENLEAKEKDDVEDALLAAACHDHTITLSGRRPLSRAMKRLLFCAWCESAAR